MNNIPDYTLRKEWPLTKEQNEIVDFMIRRTKCVCAAQTRVWKNIYKYYSYVSYIIKIPRYSCYYVNSSKSS